MYSSASKAYKLTLKTTKYDRKDFFLQLLFRTFSSALPTQIKTYNITGIGQRSECSVITDTGFTIQTDTPVKMGGSNSAPQPIELLLSSLLGCKQATAMFVARHMTPRMHIDRIEFKLHAERDQRGAVTLPLHDIKHVQDTFPARLSHITGSATVFLRPGTIATQTQIDELERQVSLRCPVASMIRLSGCAMHVPWTLATENAIRGIPGNAVPRQPKSPRGARNYTSLSCAHKARTAITKTFSMNGLQVCQYSGHACNAGTTTRRCWSCGSDLAIGVYSLFCTSNVHQGQVLQPLRDQNVDYFSLFDFSRATYLFDAQLLEQRFKALQRLNHPDKYQMSKHTSMCDSIGVLEQQKAPQRPNLWKSEQDISAANSSLINQAYQVMRDPVQRAAYMLQTYWGSNVLSEESGTNKDAKLALEIFELRETLADLLEEKNFAELRVMKTRMQAEQNKLMQTFHDALQTLEPHGIAESGEVDRHTDRLAKLVIKLKYVSKISEELNLVVEG